MIKHVISNKLSRKSGNKSYSSAENLLYSTASAMTVQYSLTAATASCEFYRKRKIGPSLQVFKIAPPLEGIGLETGFI